MKTRANRRGEKEGKVGAGAGREGDGGEERVFRGGREKQNSLRTVQ